MCWLVARNLCSLELSNTASTRQRIYKKTTHHIIHHPQRRLVQKYARLYSTSLDVYKRNTSTKSTTNTPPSGNATSQRYGLARLKKKTCSLERSVASISGNTPSKLHQVQRYHTLNLDHQNLERKRERERGEFPRQTFVKALATIATPGTSKIQVLREGGCYSCRENTRNLLK